MENKTLRGMTVQVMEKNGTYRSTYGNITDISKSFRFNKVYMNRNATEDDIKYFSENEPSDKDGIRCELQDGDMIMIAIDLNRYTLMII